ncbi:MAG: glycosyltransferase family 2 protein [Pseudobdellovibrionaceae bacterium]
MKKVSLIVPLRNESPLLQRGLQDLESFIQKFPLQWELILVIDPSQDDTLEKARQLKSEKINLQVLENAKQLGRGPSVKKGLQAAQGDFAMVFPLDFTIPLADLFQFLQELVLHPEIDLAVGNRHTSRKKREAPRRSPWHWTLENILAEKLRALPQQDPICPYLVFQKKALDQLLPELQLKAWFYTPEILQKAREKNLRISEVPVLSRDHRKSQIPLFKEYLRWFYSQPV